MKAAALLLALSLYCQWTSSFTLTIATTPKSRFKACQSYRYSDPMEVNSSLAFAVCKNAILQPGKPLAITIAADHIKYIIFKNSILPLIPLGTFSIFPNLVHLYLNRNGVKNLIPGLFSELPQLQELYLQDNNITTISTGTFNTLKNLIVLDLSRNAIKSLRKGCFAGLHKLKNLNLNRNHIYRLEREMFVSLTALQILDLSHNNVIISDPFFAIELISKNLKELYINNNFLRYFPVFLTRNLSGLDFLDVSFNDLTEIDFGLLLPSKIANYSNNQISAVKGWIDFNNTRVIDLQKNRINYNIQINGEVDRLDLKWNEMEILNTFMFSVSDKLNELDVGHNFIHKITRNCFYGLTNLQTLRLNDNKLTHLNVDCFDGLDSLGFLSLAHNYLEFLDNGIFDRLSELTTLYLDHNKLISINEEAFRNLYNLRYLYLNNNLLASVNLPFLLGYLPNLKTISLTNNNWDCDEVLSTAESFTKHSIHLSQHHSFGTLTVFEIACDSFHLEVYGYNIRESLTQFLIKSMTSVMLLLALALDVLIVTWYFTYLRITLRKSQTKMKKFEYILAKVKTSKHGTAVHNIL